jgi:predicted transcriptional regulator
MDGMRKIRAKAVGQDEQSDAIVVSFAPHWQEPLLKGVSVVIRKRFPKTVRPKWLYAYVNSPISAILGRAEIVSIDEISKAYAMGLQEELGMHAEDIAEYFGNLATIGCYRLGVMQPAVHPATLAKLSAKLIYYAPQSFFVLSHQGRNIIDGLAGFRE